jgi:hypothetical protein
MLHKRQERLATQLLVLAALELLDEGFEALTVGGA